MTEPTQEQLEELAARLAALDRRGSSWTRATLRLVEQYPGINTSALVRRTRLDRSTVMSNMRRLQELALVEHEGTGHRLTALGAALLRSQG